MDTLVFVVLPSTNDMGGGGYTRVSRWSVGWSRVSRWSVGWFRVSRWSVGWSRVSRWLIGWSRVSRWLIGWSVGEVSQTPQPVFLKVIYM